MRTTTKFFVMLAFLLPALPAPPAGAAANEATISNFSFSPEPARIPVGATLKWTNLDSTAHTVTADDGSWTSTSLNKDGTFSHAFSQPGTVRYHCAIHDSMTGTVIVEAATPTTAAPTTSTTQATTTSTAPVTPTTARIGGDGTTAPTTASSAPARSPKPAAPSTTRATTAPTTATTAPAPTTTTTAPLPAVAPQDTTVTTEAALDTVASHDGGSNAAPLAVGIGVLLIGGAAGWWAARRRTSP